MAGVVEMKKVMVVVVTFYLGGVVEKKKKVTIVTLAFFLEGCYIEKGNCSCCCFLFREVLQRKRQCYCGLLLWLVL